MGMPGSLDFCIRFVSVWLTLVGLYSIVQINFIDVETYSCVRFVGRWDVHNHYGGEDGYFGLEFVDPTQPFGFHTKPIQNPHALRSSLTISNFVPSTPPEL